MRTILLFSASIAALVAVIFTLVTSPATGSGDPWLVPSEVTLKDGRVVQCVTAPTDGSLHGAAVACDFASAK